MTDFVSSLYGGGFRVLSEGQVTVGGSSMSIFANAPVGTRMIMFSVKTTPITMRFDGGVASATEGNDFAIGRHVLSLNKIDASKVRAIKNGVNDSTVWIAYFGV